MTDLRPIYFNEARAFGKYEQAQQAFLEASAFLRRQLAEIYSLYSEPRLLVHPDGRVESLPSRLPPPVQRLADQHQQSIDQLRERCFADNAPPVPKK